MKSDTIKVKSFLSMLFLLTAGFLAVCVPVGDLQEDSRSVDKGDIESVKVELDMGAGELDVQSGADKLLDATFFYNVEKWKPRIEYEERHKRGLLKISQGKAKGIPAGRSRNRWDIYLNDEIPMELEVDFGAGDGDLDLRRMDLRSLNIDMGVGDIRVDISGSYRKDLDVSIDGGVGSAKIYLPEDIGVRVRVDKGIGSVNARGFTKRGDLYTNSAFGSSDITIDVTVDAGIGSIDLRLK